MEQISSFVESLISLMGLPGNMVLVSRHILLVLVAVILSWLSFIVCIKILIPVINRITLRTGFKWDDVIFSRKVLVSACRIVPAYVIYQLLPLVFFQLPVAKSLVEHLTAIYIVWAVTGLIIALVNAFGNLEAQHSAATQQYMRSFLGVLKIVVVFIAVVVVVSIVINKSPLHLFAGLGATSAVLMLVFQDTIQGLVAGIRLTSNEMVHKGDWITVPSTLADGEVIEMTLATVKVRNFDNTIVTVSPKTLVEGSFQNWKGMQTSAGRRAVRRIIVDCNSIEFASEALKEQCLSSGYVAKEATNGNPTNLSLYRKCIEKYLKEHAAVNTDLSYMVRQLVANETGLPIELYFFLKYKDSYQYENAVAEIMEWCFVMAKIFDIKINSRVALND